MREKSQYRVVHGKLLSIFLLCRNLTLYPHIAGSDQNYKLADDLALQWHSYGFDQVEIKNYTVLLTYPNRSSLNVLNIVSRSDINNVVYTANTTLEKPLVEGEDDPDVSPPFNAFSGTGTVNVSNRLMYRQTESNT